jgi:hypothetical protein
VTAIGIYASGTHIRLCAVTEEGDVESLECHELDHTITPMAWLNKQEQLAELVCSCLPRRDLPVYLAVPGGIYQMRRVPLEVAEEVDRRSQVGWEVSQALCAPEGQYSVDYVARGSSAIWVAIPTPCVDILSEAFSDQGVELFGLTAEPIALARALRRQDPAGRARAILSGLEWTSSVELHDGTLVAASTRNTSASEDGERENRQDGWRVQLQKRIDEASIPTYLAGEESCLADFLSEEDAPRALRVRDTNGNPSSDTLLSIAYGVALSATDEDPL